jgi:RHS repeat-associated protein
VDFTSNGRVARACGIFGDTTRFIWTDTLLTQIRDPMGKTLTLGYLNGKLQSVTDPAGRLTTYAIDGSGRLSRVTDPDNVATNLAYDANNLLTSVTDRGGVVTSFTYDALRRVDTTYAPTIQIYTGASVRPRTLARAPERVVWQPERAGTDTATKKLAVRPDTLYALSIGPLNDTVRTAPDRFGSPTKIIGPYGATTTITRDTLGRAVVTTEPNGHIARASYSGYLVSQSKDSTTGRTITYGYGSNANLTLMYGDVTREDIVYHNGNRGPVGAVDSVFTATRTVVESTHLPDALGRDTLIKDGAQHTTRMKYDSVWGSVQQTTDPRGNVTRVHYDAAGRADSTWIPASGLFTYQYDALNRRTEVKNPLGQVTRYVYGPKTLDRVIDAKGQVYKFAYNPLGLLVARHDLADTLKADTLKYDEAGNVRTVRTRRGDVITMTYDLAARMLSRSGPDFPVDSFKYDPAGRWQVAWNANQRDSSAFDQAGRLATTRQAMLGGVAYQLSYTYDIRDRLTNRSAPTGGNLTRYAYNATDGMLDTLCAAGGCVAFRRNGELLTDRRTYNPGLSGSWYFDKTFNADHSASSDAFSLTAVDQNFRATWQYDSLGRIGQRDWPGGGLLPPSAQFWRYDAVGRLTNVCAITQGFCFNEYGSEDLAYSYDAAGNRTDAAANAVIGPGNRLQTFKGFTLSYDANGNLVSKTGTGGSPAYTYTWDALSRLTEVRNGGVVVASYKYDALGRRVAATAADGTTERYVYDGDHVILDVTGAHVVKAEYGYEPGADRLFVIKNTQGAAWTGVTINDPKIGTVEGIATMSGGTIRKKYSTGVWGVAQSDTGVITRFRMGGREYDQVTKLYYMRARYYDPDLGRFLSEDPLGTDGGLNLYAYAGNDPVNARDPGGMCHDFGDGDGGGGGPPDNQPEPMMSVVASASGGGCDPFGEDWASRSGPGRFSSWAEVQAWIDWAFGMLDATGLDYLSSDMGYALPRGYPAIGDHLSIMEPDDIAQFSPVDGVHPKAVKFTFKERLIRYSTRPGEWMDPIADLGHPTLNVGKIGPNVGGIEDGGTGYIEYVGRMKVWNASYGVTVRLGPLYPVVWVTAGPFFRRPRP